jgi:hypothetical protein
MLIEFETRGERCLKQLRRVREGLLLVGRFGPHLDAIKSKQAVLLLLLLFVFLERASEKSSEESR